MIGKTQDWPQRLAFTTIFSPSVPLQSDYLHVGGARAQKVPTSIVQGNQKDILAMLSPIPRPVQGDTACADPVIFVVGGGGADRKS